MIMKKRKTTGREGGKGRGVVVGWGHTYLKTPPECFTLPKEISGKTNLYPFKLHKIVLHPSEILKDLEPQDPWKFHMIFSWSLLQQKFHIVFSKSLDILLTIPSILLETPILILFLFSNMLFSKFYSPKRTCGKAHIN